MNRRRDALGDWPAPHRWRRLLGNWVGLLPAMAVLAVLMLYPVGQLLLLSVQTRQGALTGEHFVRLFSADVYVQVLLITLKIAAWTTLISVVVSYPVAYLIANSPKNSKARLTFWVLLPFWTSFLVRTFAWLVIFGRRGVLNQIVQATGLADAPKEFLYNLGAVLVGMSHAMIPLCILSMVSVMEAIDGNLSKAALTLGARPGSTFWRIYFPLSFPGVAAGALLVFISSLGFFITPAFLGGRHETMITQIIIEQVMELLNWSFAGAISVLLLVVALIIFFIYDRVLGLSSLAGASARQTQRSETHDSRLAQAGRGILNGLGFITDAFTLLLERVSSSGHVARRRLGRAISRVVVVSILAFLSLPALTMIPVSFSNGAVIDWPPSGFSFKWYEAFWNSPFWLQATLRSFIVALGAALLALLIGTPAAFSLARSSLRGKTAILGLLLSPIIVPRIIIAIALFYLFARVGLIGTYTGLILGHTLLALPYVVVTVMAILKTYDDRYDQAAANLGATPIVTLRRVTLPIIQGGLVSAFLFAFITSFDELTIALFVTGGLNTTLPKQMWDDAILRVTPTLAAASTMLLIFVTVLILIAERMRRRVEML